MTMMSIRIPDDLKHRMRAADVAWSAVVREAIEAKLAQLERQQILSAVLDLTSPVGAASAGTAAASIRADRDGH